MRHLLTFVCLLYSLQSFAQMQLSTDGTPLPSQLIDIQNPSNSINIIVSADDVQATYAAMILGGGEIVQRTPDGGFVPWDVELASLQDNGLNVANGRVTYPVLSGDLSQFEFPLTVYIAYTDSSEQLYYGFFEVLEGFTPITAAQWDETAVRKVLHAFAFGGHASDIQIQQWAISPPTDAIQQMLQVDSNNPLLSFDADGTFSQTDSTLTGLSEFLSGPMSPIEADSREDYELDTRRSPSRIWRESVTLRGLNPVRQKIGLFETNYHMAVNQSGEVGINNQQIVRYYDDIMNSQTADEPYQQTLARAASSAAVASQYNHRYNVFDNGTGEFRGNEDFAREYHQLFFGILGEYGLDYHEEVTIKNTALALTDMPIPLVNGQPGDEVEFGTEQHHQADLEILLTDISGETAEEKLLALAEFAILHPESETNLPVIIVQHFADDNLTQRDERVLRNVWMDMPSKNLLEFLQMYATSTLFHSADRVKYRSSIDRHLTVMNGLTLSNEETYRDLYNIEAFNSESGMIFSPVRDVFGGQTGIDAANDAGVFSNVFNRSTRRATVYNRPVLEEDGQVVWEKNWAVALPVDSNGAYNVSTIAPALWERFIADGLKNFGSLEQMYVYSLLATGLDPAYNLDPGDLQRIISSADAEGGDATLTAFLEQWASSNLDLASADPATRQEANRRVGQAINFIVATPFMFAQEGR